jgi:threonyl-tRNA synthetase
MNQKQITLPDGNKKNFPEGISFYQVAEAIGPGLAKSALAVRVDGSLMDVSRSLESDVSVQFITTKNQEALEIIRHSCAHVLAMAVQKLWPGTQVTIGPVVDDGFYYDFAFPDNLKISEKDFEAIEAEMAVIVKAGHVVKREVWERDKAVSTFEAMGEKFKGEIIRDLPQGEEVSVYHMGDWFDLCRGPHVPNTKMIPAFKLTKIAGAYWRGDEKNPMLTRIYGTAWGSKQELDEYLFMLEEAKKRDHRLLGKQLDLFSFHNEAPANPFFHPKGATLYNQLMRFMRDSNKRYGFEEIHTPLMMNVELWHKSGHYDNYRDNMYFTKVDDNDAAVKPMNCPGHCLVYSTGRRSYRELPVRLSEFGRVHRHERSGVTHGLFRVRSFVQDDAHVFCTPDQILVEIQSVLKQIDEAYTQLGFAEFRIELSTRPEKSIGSDEMWSKAESALEAALKASGKAYKLNPGDGAFYGPKIDFHLIDSLKRSWQCGTVQLDFSMPERFGLKFQSSADKEETPVMIHRAVLGSIERFLGIFVEHYAGHFPIWAAPIQARLLTTREAVADYALKTQAILEQSGLRVDLDLRSEKLGYKVREAQLAKIPYQVVLGDKEEEKGLISPRLASGKQLDPMSPKDFMDLIRSEHGALARVFL